MGFPKGFHTIFFVVVFLKQKTNTFFGEKGGSKEILVKDFLRHDHSNRPLDSLLGFFWEDPAEGGFRWLFLSLLAVNRSVDLC